LLRGTRYEEISAGKARLAQAQAALDALKAGSRKEEIAQMQAMTKAAEASARSVRQNGKERIVYAPQSGVVERIPVSVGDLIGVGTTVVRLSNPADIWLRVYVPEAKLGSVSVNGDALLQVDGISEPVQARVESVAMQGEFTPANLQTPEERGKQVFAVRLRLKQTDPRIKAGMYVTVKRLGSITL
jgi:multidrug resistance efflux pump